MADPTDNLTPTDSTSDIIPPQIVATLKQQIPGATDEMLAGAWKIAVDRDPSVAADPQGLAQKMIQSFSTAKNGQPGGTVPPAAPVLPAPNNAAGQPGGTNPLTPTSTPEPTTVAPAQAQIGVPPQAADPFKGANYTQTDLMNQFDPTQVKQAYDQTALKNAYAQQQDWFNQTNGQRQASAFFNAQVPGSTAGQDFTKGQEAQMMLQTIGKQTALMGFDIKAQEALQAAATQGLAAGKSAVEIANAIQDGFGKFADNVVKGLGTTQQQNMYDPSSPETLMAKSMITKQLSAMTLPPDAMAQVKQAMSDPSISAARLMPLMAQYIPAAFGAFKDAANIGKTVAETAKTAAETINVNQANKLVAENQNLGTPAQPNPQGGVQPVGATGAPGAVAAPAPATPNPNPTFKFAPGSDLASIRQQLAGQGPNVLAAFDKQFPNIGQPAAAPTPAPTRMQQLTAGTTPEQYAATKAQLGGAANAKELPPTVPVGPPVMNALNEGRVSPEESDPSKIAEADTGRLSDIQLLQKKSLESTDPQQIMAYGKQIEQLGGPKYKTPIPLNISQVSSAGVHMGQSQLSQQNQSHTSNDIAATQQQLGVYNNGGKPAAQNALLNAGIAGPNFENIVPARNPKAQQFSIDVNKLNADAQALGLVAGGDNTAGGAISGAGAAVAALAPSGLAKAGGAALSALGGMLGNGQAITTRSDPKVVAAMSVAVQEVAAKKSMLVAQQAAFADRNNGDATNFVGSPVYNTIVNSKPLVNPTTGEVKVPVTNDQRIALKKAGFGDAQIFLGNK